MKFRSKPGGDYRVVPRMKMSTEKPLAIMSLLFVKKKKVLEWVQEAIVCFRCRPGKS